MLADEIEEMRSKCIGCGACEDVCPSSKYSKCNPYTIMQTGDGDLLNCIACHSCSSVCENTDPCNTIKKMTALKYGLHVPDEYFRTGFSAPISDISKNDLKTEWDGDDVQIMTGCVVKCAADFLEYSTYISLKNLNIRCKEVDGNACCLRPALFSEIDTSEKLLRKQKIVSESNGNEILALCGGCYEEMENIGNGATNIIDFFHRYIDRLPKLDRNIKIAIEPGCSLAHLTDKIADITDAIGCTYVKNEYGCCGKMTSVADKLMADREEECKNADLIIVTCPKCFTKYDAVPNGKPVMYLTELIAFSFGNRESLAYHKIKVDF